MPRFNAPGVLHHVMGRGIERKEIFSTMRIAVIFSIGWLFQSQKARWIALCLGAYAESFSHLLQGSKPSIVVEHAENTNRFCGVY